MQKGTSAFWLSKFVKKYEKTKQIGGLGGGGSRRPSQPRGKWPKSQKPCNFQYLTVMTHLYLFASITMALQLSNAVFGECFEHLERFLCSFENCKIFDFFHHFGWIYPHFQNDPSWGRFFSMFEHVLTNVSNFSGPKIFFSSRTRLVLDR